MSASLLRAIVVGFGLSLGAFALLQLPACGSSEEPRRGSAGESCARTDDCASPLACVDKVCTDPSAKPDGGGGGGAGGGTSTSAGVGGQGPSADAGPWSSCDKCLDTTCAAELAACDEECLAIEACIETLCAHLSAIDVPKEEGACQVKCQEDHAGAKQKHLDVVNCAAVSCMPPCVPYPDDDDACRVFMNKGDCKAARAACMGSSDCQTYSDCVSSCTTFKDCIACDDTPSGQAGRALLESYQRCLAGECILVSWLPPP